MALRMNTWSEAPPVSTKCVPMRSAVPWWSSLSSTYGASWPVADMTCAL